MRTASKRSLTGSSSRGDDGPACVGGDIGDTKPVPAVGEVLNSELCKTRSFRAIRSRTSDNDKCEISSASPSDPLGRRVLLLPGTRIGPGPIGDIGLVMV